MKGTLADQAEILAGLIGLDEQVATLAARLDAIAPDDGGEPMAYQPAVPPRFWKLDGEARQEAIAKLRAWVEQVYRPGYGHLAAALGSCWEQHPLCLYTLDWLSELWSVLYLQPQPDHRDPRRAGRMADPAGDRGGRADEPRDQPVRPRRRPQRPARPDRTPAMSDRPGSTLDRALAYARSRLAGVPVPARFARNPPPGTASSTPAPTPARSGPGGSASPTANLAIATGQPGPDVLDVDQHGPAGSGFAAFRRLRDEGLLDTASAIVATPGGGLHAYFTGSDQPSGRLPRQHLDFRARGGYVLAPPSQVDGRPYRLIAPRPTVRRPGLGRRHQPARARAPGRPARARAAAPGDLSHLAAWVGRLQEGNRNAGLFWAACRAVEAGQPAVLDDLAAAAAATGLTGREIARTISSARRGSQRPFEHQGGREAAP